MDLIILVLTVALIGFVVWLITTKITMPPYWAQALQILALAVVVLYLLSRFRAYVPNLLP